MISGSSTKDTAANGNTLSPHLHFGPTNIYPANNSKITSNKYKNKEYLEKFYHGIDTLVEKHYVGDFNEAIIAHRDGNYFFNALSLSICELIETDTIKPKKEFYDILAKKLKVTSLNHVKFKQWLNENQDTVERQVQIQSVLREIASNFICNNYDEILFNDLIDKLEANHAYDSNNSDDLTPFYEYLLKYNNISSLKAWWNDRGKKEYFEFLKKSASNVNNLIRRGSYIEVKAIALFFGINILLKNSKGYKILGVKSGFISGDKISREEIEVLSPFNVGESSFNGFVINVHSKEKLSRLLPISSKVLPEIIKILDKCNSQSEFIETLKNTFRKKRFKQIYSQLLIREIITPDDEEWDKNLIVQNLNGIRNDNIISSLHNFFKSETPCIGILMDGSNCIYLRSSNIQQKLFNKLYQKTVNFEFNKNIMHFESDDDWVYKDIQSHSEKNINILLDFEIFEVKHKFFLISSDDKELQKRKKLLIKQMETNRRLYNLTNSGEKIRQDLDNQYHQLELALLISNATIEYKNKSFLLAINHLNAAFEKNKLFYEIFKGNISNEMTLSINKIQATLYNLKALALRASKHESKLEIIKSFQKAIEIDPNNAHLYSNLAWYLNRINLLNYANKFHWIAAGKLGNDPVILNGIAFSCFALRKYEEAEDFYKYALQLNPPNLITINNNLAWLMICKSRESSEEESNELELLNSAKKLLENNLILKSNYSITNFQKAHASYYLGIIHAQLGNKSKAIENFNFSKTLCSNHVRKKDKIQETISKLRALNYSVKSCRLPLTIEEYPLSETEGLFNENVADEIKVILDKLIVENDRNLEEGSESDILSGTYTYKRLNT